MLSKSKVPKIQQKIQPLPQRKAAKKAAIALQQISNYYNDPANKLLFYMAAMTKPDDKAYLDARAAHQATIVHYTKKDGTRGGCIGKGTGAAYEHDFNGKTQPTEFVSVEEVDVGLFNGDDEEEEPVPRKWRRLRPKYQLP